MAKKKYFFFPAVFAVYFLIFAVSPISGTAEFAKAYGQDLNAFNVKLLIADLFNSGHKKQDNRLRPANFLFRKKRAILSSDDLKTAGDHGQFLKAAAYPDVPDEMLHRAADPDKSHKSRHVRTRYSGLSPPFA